MPLVDRRDGRNFGYGRQLSYAGPQALKDVFGGGHYGTVKAHSDRWQAFVKWCRSEQGPGINDARQIERKMLVDYAAYLCDLFIARGYLVSPLDVVGSRSGHRAFEPTHAGYDPRRVFLTYSCCSPFQCKSKRRSGALWGAGQRGLFVQHLRSRWYSQCLSSFHMLLNHVFLLCSGDASNPNLN